MKDVIKHCRENPGALFCVFPFQNDDGQVLRLEVKNPFYSAEEHVKERHAAMERLKDAPKRLAELAKLVRG